MLYIYAVVKGCKHAVWSMHSHERVRVLLDAVAPAFSDEGAKDEDFIDMCCRVDSALCSDFGYLLYSNEHKGRVGDTLFNIVVFRDCMRDTLVACGVPMGISIVFVMWLSELLIHHNMHDIKSFELPPLFYPTRKPARYCRLKDRDSVRLLFDRVAAGVKPGEARVPMAGSSRSSRGPPRFH